MSVSNPGNLLDGPESAERSADGPELKRCEQCGRLGTRLFTTYPANGYGAPEITVCSAKAACRKRWPKPARDRAPRDRHCDDAGCTCGHRVERYGEAAGAGGEG